jgi:hypothetical protein
VRGAVDVSHSTQHHSHGSHGTPRAPRRVNRRLGTATWRAPSCEIRSIGPALVCMETPARALPFSLALLPMRALRARARILSKRVPPPYARPCVSAARDGGQRLRDACVPYRDSCTPSPHSRSPPATRLISIRVEGRVLRPRQGTRDGHGQSGISATRPHIGSTAPYTARTPVSLRGGRADTRWRTLAWPPAGGVWSVHSLYASHRCPNNSHTPLPAATLPFQILHPS